MVPATPPPGPSPARESSHNIHSRRGELALECIEPSSREELRKIIREAVAEKKMVHLVGNHPAATCCNDPAVYLINLKHQEREIKVDIQKRRVTVGVAVSMRELKSTLHQHGLCIPGENIDPHITIGEVCGAAHGMTGRGIGSFQSCVEQVELMSAEGEVLTVSDVLGPPSAAGFGPGVAAIPLTLTLSTTPVAPFHISQYPIDLQQLLECFQVHCSSSQYFSICWFPAAGCLARHARLHQPDSSMKELKSYPGFLRCFAYNLAVWTITFLSWMFRWKNLPRKCNWLLFSLGYKKRLSMIKDQREIKSPVNTHLYHCEEWFIPRDLVPVALFELEAVIGNGKLPVHRVDVSMVKGNGFIWSPVSKPDSAAICVYVTKSFPVPFVYESIYKSLDKILQAHSATLSIASHCRLRADQALFNQELFLQASTSLDPNHVISAPFLASI